MSGEDTDKFARLKLADNGVFPLRVIDIQASLDSKGGLVFITPTNWHFHAISHTWSLHIRQLSEAIGRKLVGQSSYDDAFRHARLHDQPGFTHLLQFFTMIRADGVEKVWFDAVCINQVDDNEKSHEILHMGSFYFHSLGCYTVAHGFGRGFTLTTNALHDDDHDSQPESMPRWFSRVWTLQEWLLPRRLTFVVELDKLYIWTIISQVRKSHEFGECECKGELGGQSGLWLWGTRNPYSSRPTEKERAVDAIDEEEFWTIMENSCYKCLCGRFQKITDNMTGVRGSDETSLYWVDRIPYLYLLDCMEPKNDSVYEVLFTFEALWNGGYPGIVRAISFRHCSNKEDRVLSVLALLGLDGKLQQLQTGRSLDEQIVQMGKAMAIWNLEGLITMCVAFFEPYPSPLKLSWAPHFEANPGIIDYAVEAEKLDVASFHHTTATVSVSSKGLSLSCYMIKGRLVPYKKHVQECTSGVEFFDCKLSCYTCSSRMKHHSSDLSFALQIASYSGHTFGFNRKYGNEQLVLTARDELRNTPQHYYCQGRVHFNVDLTMFNASVWGSNLVPSSIQFNVWLLLLGTYQKKLTVTRTVLVFMVCVGAKDNLQKVGMVHMLPTYSYGDCRRSSICLDSFERWYCTIGGFSKENWTQWMVEQLDSSPWWNYT